MASIEVRSGSTYVKQSKRLFNRMDFVSSMEGVIFPPIRAGGKGSYLLSFTVLFGKCFCKTEKVSHFYPNLLKTYPHNPLEFHL